jgi:hypothetical protein
MWPIHALMYSAEVADDWPRFARVVYEWSRPQRPPPS